MFYAIKPLPLEKKKTSFPIRLCLLGRVKRIFAALSGFGKTWSDPAYKKKAPQYSGRTVPTAVRVFECHESLCSINSVRVCVCVCTPMGMCERRFFKACRHWFQEGKTHGNTHALPITVTISDS